MAEQQAPAQAPAPDTNIPAAPARPEMVGSKTAEAVKSETEQAIADILAEGVDDAEEAPAETPAQRSAKRDAAKAKAEGKGKSKAETKDEPAEETESDFEPGAEPDADEPESDDSADEGDADSDEDDAEEAGKEKQPKPASLKQARKELKRKADEVEVERGKIAQQWQELQRVDSELSRAIEAHNARFGRFIDAQSAVQRGDKEAVALMFEGVTGMPVDEAIRYLAGVSTKTPEQIRIDNLEKERKRERDEQLQRQQREQAEAQDRQLVEGIGVALTRVKHKLARHPEAGKLVLDWARANGKTDGSDRAIASYASEVMKGFRAQRDMLNRVLGAAAATEDGEREEQAQNTATTPRQVKRAALNRAEATVGATQTARPMTTGDAIADTLEELGIKPSSKQSWRGKKVGAA